MKISSYAVLSNPQLGDKLIGTDVNNMDVTKNFTIQSLFQLASTSGLFVPYTGATNDVDLGLNSIRAVALIKDGGTASQFLKADGTVDSTSYVPYTGATTNVNLGANNITSNSFIKVGGTASQFLKANGTVDSNTYATTSQLSSLALYYGSFYDTTAQSATLANTAYPIKLNSTDTTATSGVSVITDGLGDNTIIKPANAGVYNIAFSAQLRRSTGGSSETVNFWLKKNGTNVAYTNTSVSVQANAGLLVAAWNFFIQMDAGAEVQLMWSTTSTAITLPYAGSAAPHPETPSVILTVNKVS
jgi:hypothetical protein